MSRAVHLTAADLMAVADFLTGLDELVVNTGVRIIPGDVVVEDLDGNWTLTVGFDSEAGTYAIDEVVGQ